VLAAGSAVFCKRLEDWCQDPWTVCKADGKPQLLVVGVEEDLQEAAQAILKLMYEEVVPDGLVALQLAKVGEGRTAS
jgi:hypothetical protein